MHWLPSTTPSKDTEWAHWTRGFQNVIRAYAFHDYGEVGIRIVGQGEVPTGIADALSTVAESTGLHPRPQSFGSR
jgi:hypothetical protein